MAAALLPDHVDQTPALINSFLGAGGKKETTNSSVSVDPAATAALHQLLTSQLSGSTPEGAAALLQAIFQQGMQQVPGLATTYGQAAGARVGSNSPLQLAMQDMMLKLTQEASKQLAGNQQNAANTAAKLAESTASKNTTSTTSPRVSAMQMLPFLFANGDKIGKLAKKIPGMENVASFFGGDNGGTGVNFGTSMNNVEGADNLALANDFGPGSGNSGGGVDTSVGADALSGAASSILGDSSNILDFASGAQDLGFFDPGAGDSLATPDFADSIFNSDFGFARGGLVRTAGSKRKPQMMMQMKAPGYARGGLVTRGYANGGQVTNAGGNTNSAGSGNPTRGVTYNDNGMGESMDLLRALTEAANPVQSPTSKPAPVQGTSRKLTSVEDEAGAAGASGTGVGTATGAVGTPASNAAAVNGMAAAVAGLATGVPGLAAAMGLGLNAMGVPTSSMSPVSQAVTAIVNSITTGNPAGVDGGVASGAVAAEGLNGMSAPSVTVGDGVTTSGMSTPSSGEVDGGTNASNTSTGDVGDNASTGDSEGSGDSSGGEGTSGDSFKGGGSVQGPGTATSDSILARLSDGEYVIPAHVVDALGVPFFDAINSMFSQGQSKQGAARG